VICATRGHGELALEPHPSGHDWSAVAQRLRGDGMTVQLLDAGAAIPPACNAVVVGGPTVPFTPEEALAIQRHVRDGGGLVVAAGGPVNGALPPTGLEGVLVAEGLGLPAAIAVDPSLAVREIPNALYVVDGYADHPINQGFVRVRPTLWVQPRAVLVSGGARSLVAASAASWGERDLIDPPAKNADDLAGPVALAGIGSTHRVIAVGSADSLTSAVLAGGASAGDLWFARAVRFASGAPEPSVAVAARAPQQVRLVMTADQRRAIIALSVGGIPIAWALIGGVVVLWRRRRAR
jgi:hypothetical protein